MAAPTSRTTVRRHRERADYDRATIEAILDEALVCHVAAVIDGAPSIIPTMHAREGETLYLHGAAGNRTLKALAAGASEACVEATILDGLVLARSALNHSMNYRSVVLYGPAEEVTDPAAKLSAMRALVERVHPGRWDEVRAPNAKELAQTFILRMPIEEASAKVRTGGPIDDPEDLDLPVWAGTIPIEERRLTPVPD